MLPNELPACVCGSRNWKSGGGSFGGNLSQQSFTCESCGRLGLLLASGVGCGLVVPIDVRQELTKAEQDYLNDVVLVVWRDWREKVEKAQEPIADDWQLKVCKILGIPSDTKGDSIPEDKRKNWRTLWDELYGRDEFRFPLGYLQPLWPQLPETLSVTLRSYKDYWYPMLHADVADLPIPPDPVNTSHVNLFNRVFYAVSSQLGITIKRREVENQYSSQSTKNEPWYEFSIGRFKISVGPRKRVYAINMACDEKFVVKEIRKLAQKDETTYYADDEWQNENAQAKSIGIHAWGEQKLVEYLVAMGKVALSQEKSVA